MPTRRPADAPEPSLWPALALGAALVVYGWWFFFQPLAELSRDPAEPFRRWDIFRFLIVAPEVWAERWFANGNWSLLDRVPIVVAAGLILAAAWLIGQFLLRLVRADSLLTRWEQSVFAVGAGLNVLSLGMLALGLAGFANSRAAVSVGGLAIVSLYAAQSLRRGARRSRAAISLPVTPAIVPGAANSTSAWQPGSRWVLLASVPFVLVTLLGGMLPASDFDVCEYHLQAPKEFFQAGRISFLPHNVYANMPLGSEMHSLLGMVILNDWWMGALVGKTVQACFAPLAGLALLAAGGRWYSNRTGAWAATIYLSTPWIVHVATAGLVEAAAAFYLCAALFALFVWRDEEAGGAQTLPIGKQTTTAQAASVRGMLCLSGFLAGSAVATKYPAALFVVVPLTLLLLFWRGLASWRSVGWFLLAVALACGPWLAKNAWLSGNPTYPLLYELFGGGSWDAEKNARWNSAHRPENFAIADPNGSLPRDLVESSVDLFVRSPWLNFVTWPLGLAAVLAWKRQRLVAPLFGYLLFVLVAWWLLTHRIDRFWVPAVSIASLLAAVGACLDKSLAWRIVTGAALAVALVYDFTLVATNTGAGSSNRFFVALSQLRGDPERLRPWQLWLNEHTPVGKRVFSEGDAAVFDLEMPVRYHTAFDDSPLVTLVDGKSADERRQALRDFAFVYVNWNEINRYRSPGNYGYAEQVTPELFRELVEQGVLEPPVPHRWGPGIEIYPVK